MLVPIFVQPLYYFSALKTIFCALAAPTQLVQVTVSCRPPPLKSQWWRSHSGRLPLTVNLPALPCPHRLHLTNQSWQSFPSKPFFNQHAKCCELYLPLQSIFRLTCQAKPFEKVLSFLNRLPVSPSHFRTDTPSKVL